MCRTDCTTLMERAPCSPGWAPPRSPSRTRGQVSTRSFPCHPLLMMPPAPTSMGPACGLNTALACSLPERTGPLAAMHLLAAQGPHRAFRSVFHARPRLSPLEHSPPVWHPLCGWGEEVQGACWLVHNPGERKASPGSLGDGEGVRRSRMSTESWSCSLGG